MNFWQSHDGKCKQLAFILYHESVNRPRNFGISDNWTFWVFCKLWNNVILLYSRLLMMCSTRNNLLPQKLEIKLFKKVNLILCFRKMSYDVGCRLNLWADPLYAKLEPHENTWIYLPLSTILILHHFQLFGWSCMYLIGLSRLCDLSFIYVLMVHQWWITSPFSILSVF